ncbi:partitioning defective 3 homolog B-like isoform X2 [Salarias fasciatus]|uniref:Partitioning defective 3 homolog B-like n=1 Tax=Salarias fasciatus TaxID=181472 RepID=A0A672FKR4_SALFA|nr:partitioning defective 3 homolog B-like isoform X2 [Salarias fasciatus]
MKVTVTFGDTSVVVPCKSGWTVRDLTEQATRRYRRTLEQSGGSEVKTHHLEYSEGGILDMDDLLVDLVEDRDKLVAVFQEAPYGRTDSPRESLSNGFSSDAPSPEPLHYYSHLQYQEPSGGEIEVNEASLKANTPLLVRSSSDSALAPPFEMTSARPAEHRRNASPDPESSDELRAAFDRLSDEQNSENMSHVHLRNMTRSVEILADRGPLGIHVVPYCSSLSGRTLGLHIKGIEANSRSKRDSLFQEDECIVQINDVPLQDKTFAQSQEVFRQAMGSPSVRLEVLPAANKSRYEKSLIGQLFTSDIKDPASRTKSPLVARAKADSQPEPRPGSRSDLARPDSRARTPDPALREAPPADLRSRPGSIERASPTDPAGGARSSPALTSGSQDQPEGNNPVLAALANLANKKGGKKIRIDLKKGVEGLGFTVVTRDSPANGPSPILVKNILQRGAAIKDGRLQPGDRILEVNGVDMTGRSQEELVAMLRSTKQGESVSVVVARQDDIFLPRELKGEEAGSLVLEDGREQLMYEIPLNETGSAGLGVSLKGNKSRETGEDLGIFIKSIIHGGAAYKDGRLNVNDQLIAVNGESLLGRSNHTAMETLRRSMSSEGNARGTIQLVVLRASRQDQQTGGGAVAAARHPDVRPASTDQDAYHRPSRPPSSEPVLNGASSSRALHPAAATNGGSGHYSNDEDDVEQSHFPPPPSPGTVEQINRELPSPGPPQRSGYQTLPHPAPDFYTSGRLVSDGDDVPRNRASKSMDMVADESNVGSLIRPRREPAAAGGALGPTLGLWKSSSLESLQSAMSEAKQSRVQVQVPFHRPRPHVVRGRGCNQSFRIAIDKSYEGPSEDDDDLSENSSGRDTPASSSSRQDLDAEDEKKKSKGKKKAKKSKGKKKQADSAEDPEKKSKKKGFGLLRFGRKKEDKSKDGAKTSKSKLEALSEEELERLPGRLDGYDPRYAHAQSGHATPDMEDDDSDPNYARINNFRAPPSPQSYLARTPSPANPPPPSPDELDGLYAKVNKPRPPPQTQADSDQRVQAPRREQQQQQQARAAPGYDELDAARRRFLEHDPHRAAPRGAEPRAERRYDDAERTRHTQPRRDPYDYPTHSRAGPRDPSPYSGRYHDPPVPGHSSPRYHPQQPPQQHRATSRQDVPPSPGAGQGGRHFYEAAGGRVDAYRRQASPGRYGEERAARRKEPVVGAV